MRWDPGQYAKFTDERSRPFFDLVGQVGCVAPRHVVDLGCGSGALTVALRRRWPAAFVEGIDASPEMIERAPREEGVSFRLGRVEDFTAAGVDVLVSNAVLHWVPRHDRLLNAWAEQLETGGWMAFAVPANFDSPSHQLMYELARSARWRERLGHLAGSDAAVLAPATYLDLLLRSGLQVTAWQTEYFHVLAGKDPVLEWVRGTVLRPFLAALPPDAADAFTAEYAAALRTAYPPRSYGTVFPFLRTFVVARKER